MYAALIAVLLPASLAPPPPFPRVQSQRVVRETIAPGIDYAEYRLVTADGPLVVHAIAAERRADVRIDAVLAHDQLTSPQGETISSMAKRSDAVAGINGDYYDIDGTNRPINVVVRDGELLHSPRKRYALFVSSDGTPRVAESAFTGEVALGDRTLALDAVNELPQSNGTALLTPAFGPVTAPPGATLIALERDGGSAPLFSYRVAQIVDASQRQPAGWYLALGSNVAARATLPQAGDAVVASGTFDGFDERPPIAAIGGGPLILHDGAWIDDPDGPNGGDYIGRSPSSGAGTGANGTLYLAQVDGRKPLVSIGVTRRELAALFAALGAREALAFDGGGSAALAARTLGERNAVLVSTPSDDRERPVGDGLFVFSSAPIGAPVRVVALPREVRALRGAVVPLRIAALDSAEHVVASDAPSIVVEPSSLGTVRDGAFVAATPGSGAIVVRAGLLVARVPVEVVGEPSRLTIEPGHPNVERRGVLSFTARAFDASDAPIALPENLPWRSSDGAIDQRGRFTASNDDAVVSLALGARTERVRVSVGTHDVALPIESLRFMTVPRGGDGTAGIDAACRCAVLNFHLSGAERTAYAVFDRPLPPETVGIAFDLGSDGSGARVKIALRDGRNQSVLLPAASLDASGWQGVQVRLPLDFPAPGRLVAIYALAAHSGDAIDGQLAIRNLRAVVAGSR